MLYGKLKINKHNIHITLIGVLNMVFCPECGKENDDDSIRCLNCGNYFIDINKPFKGEYTNIADQIGTEHFDDNTLAFDYPENYLLAPPNTSEETVAALVHKKGICDIMVEASNLDVEYVEGFFEQNHINYLQSLGYFDINVIPGFDYKKCCFQALTNSPMGIVKSLIYFDFNKALDIRITLNSLNYLNYDALPDLKIIAETMDCYLKCYYLSDEFFSTLNMDVRNNACKDMMNDGIVYDCYSDARNKRIFYEKNTNGEYMDDSKIINNLTSYLLKHSDYEFTKSGGTNMGYSDVTIYFDSAHNIVKPDANNNVGQNNPNLDKSKLNLNESNSEVHIVKKIYDDSIYRPEIDTEICNEMVNEGFVKDCYIEGSDFYYTENTNGKSVGRGDIVERVRNKGSGKTFIQAYNEARAKNKNSGCYVATSIYGSYDCPEVWTLRRYRDNTLDKHILGKLFIKTYYTTSPTIVKYFGDKKWFNNIFKPILDNFVNKLQENGVESTYYDGN